MFAHVPPGPGPGPGRGARGQGTMGAFNGFNVINMPANHTRISFLQAYASNEMF